MNKPSERIVVFVSPAQKRAIAASAERLGISVSELMRRAVLSFGATSEQVKAASIVDRLRAPREPDALNEALQRVARATKHARDTTPAALRTKAAAPAPRGAPERDVPNPGDVRDAAMVPPSLLTPVAPLDAVAAPAEAEAPGDTDVEALARVTAAKAAALVFHATTDAPAAPSPAAAAGMPLRERIDGNQREDGPARRPG